MHQWDFYGLKSLLTHLRFVHSKQVSSRGGEVYCELLRDRILISGKAVQYMKGQIEV